MKNRGGDNRTGLLVSCCLLSTPPLDKSLSLARPGTGIAFHGTSDPWASTSVLDDVCAKRNIPLHIIENANHSLETGDLATDLSILQGILATISEYIGY